MTLLYKVLSRDERTLDSIIRTMGDYIIMRGNKIVRDEALLESFDLFTKALLELKKHMDGLIEISFRNNVHF